jgi:hypothetical protein
MEEQYNQIEALLRRVGLFLEDGEWAQADAYCERILDMDPENARAYTGKLFAKFQVNNTQQFLQVAAQRLQEVMADPNTKKVLRFGTDQEKAIFQHILSGVEQERRRQQETALTNSCSAVQRGHVDVALHNFDILKEQIPNNHRLWFWRMMARLQCRNLFALVDKGIPINKDPDFLKAVACADSFQAQSYRDTAKQVLFSTHIKCQMGLVTDTGPKENTEHWMDLYLNNCEENDPYGAIYRTLRKIQNKNWNDTLITGALIHIQDIYRREMAAGRLKELDDELFSSEICSYVQSPGMYLSLEYTIADRLDRQKQKLSAKYKSSLISSISNVSHGTVKLKALRSPAPRPTPPVLARDYVGELLYQRNQRYHQELWSQYTYAPRTVNADATVYMDHGIRCWCEPDCLFAKAAGTEMLPIPAEAVKKDEPREPWQRYAHIARQSEYSDDLAYCVKKIKELAPEEFGRQHWLQDLLMDKLVGVKDRVSLIGNLKTMQALYPQDYRTHYGHLRQLTSDFKKPETFIYEYRSLSNKLKELKKRDIEGAQKLKERYQKLRQKICDYMEPYAAAAKEHGEPLSFGQLSGIIPDANAYMLSNWLGWWQPLKEENDTILRQIGEDLAAIEEKGQKGFSWFRR